MTGTRSEGSACCHGFWQGYAGEKLAQQPGPHVPRHATEVPLPGIEAASDGRVELPEPVLTWRGSIFSIYSAQVADWGGAGYGPLLETPSVRACSGAPPLRVSARCGLAS